MIFRVIIGFAIMLSLLVSPFVLDPFDLMFSGFWMKYIRKMKSICTRLSCLMYQDLKLTFMS